jgi:hypothetical protein
MQRFRLAGRPKSDQGPSCGTAVRGSRQDLLGKLAARRQPRSGHQRACFSTRRGGESAEQSLLPVGVLNSAGEHHDCRAAGRAAPAAGHHRRRRSRPADTAAATAASKRPAASVAERRSRPLGSPAGYSRAVNSVRLRPRMLIGTRPCASSLNRPAWQAGRTASIF